jgi:hypothetical protein
MPAQRDPPRLPLDYDLRSLGTCEVGHELKDFIPALVSQARLERSEISRDLVANSLLSSPPDRHDYAVCVQAFSPTFLGSRSIPGSRGDPDCDILLDLLTGRFEAWNVQRHEQDDAGTAVGIELGASALGTRSAQVRTVQQQPF